MLDSFTVMHRGGAVLWEKALSAVKGNPVNDLIKTVLLEERSGEMSAKVDNFFLKWALVNEFDLIFVMVYPQAASLMFLDELLDSLKDSFLGMFKHRITSVPVGPSRFDFEAEFSRILHKHEEDAKARRKKTQKNFDETQLAKDIRNPNEKKDITPATGSSKTKSSSATAEDHENEEEPVGQEDEESEGVQSLRSRTGSMRVQRSFVKKEKKGDKNNNPTSPTNETDSDKKKKISRSWDPLLAASKGPVDPTLDRSTDKPADGAVFVDEGDRNAYLGTGVANVDDWEVDSDDDADGDDTGKSASTKSKASAGGSKTPSGPEKKSSSRGIFSYLKGLTGTRALEQADLEPVLNKFREMLVEKNVAVEIADKLCSSVGTSLAGKKTSGFNGVKNAVKEALEEGLTRILTPKQSMDVLCQVRAVKAKGRPYVIVFVGVNGVGKSTSLSKVCFWLKSQGLKVLLSACDTFRSGAVEQLKTHAARLDVPVYEKGYNKDAASIAMDSVKYAQQNGFDVVLVDTAGRMQDNEPLMRALSKLVNLNNPDLVLFVGEALVGNDSIDQVTKFNQALKETAYGNGQPRLIDGIMLTKFDTIDDKVGAAVSMVYVTGQPVVFVGVGQTYTDLKKLNVRNIVKLLLR